MVPSSQFPDVCRVYLYSSTNVPTKDFKDSQLHKVQYMIMTVVIYIHPTNI